MNPEVIGDLGAIAVFAFIVAAAVRGDLRFRPGVEGQLAAKDETIRELRDSLARSEAREVRLVDAVDKLGDALEARNRRDERNRRVGQ